MSATDGRGDFDFLHGTWAVHHRRLTRRFAGSDDWQEFDSVGTISPIQHGLGNIDAVAIPDFPGLGAVEGFTVRLFDPERRLWTIYWASTAQPGRFFPPLVGAFSDGLGIFDGEDTEAGKPVLVRFEWTPGTDTARWQQAFSADGGTTWEVNWIMELTRTS